MMPWSVLNVKDSGKVAVPVKVSERLLQNGFQQHEQYVGAAVITP